MTPAELDRYAWQIWTPDFGEAGQQRLHESSVLVSRLGGVGGTVAYYLAAAGIGKLVLAHAGDIKPSDLNRQLLMSTPRLGQPRIESVVDRLREFNPHVEVVPVAENLGPQNASQLIEQVDIVVDAAPLFEERFAMNTAAVAQRKPLVECAMYDFDAQLTTLLPGEDPVPRLSVPGAASTLATGVPVFGAVSGVVASLAAVEVIKLVTGLGEPLRNTMLHANLRTMEFRRLPIARNLECPVCGSI